MVGVACKRHVCPPAKNWLAFRGLEIPSQQVFKDIKSSDIDSNCNYNGKKLYILCKSSESNVNDPADLTHINILSACTLSTEKFYGSEEGTITNPENSGQENNKEDNNGNEIAATYLPKVGGAVSGRVYSSANVGVDEASFRNINIIPPNTNIEVGVTAIPTGEIWIKYE